MDKGSGLDNSTPFPSSHGRAKRENSASILPLTKAKAAPLGVNAQNFISLKKPGQNKPTANDKKLPTSWQKRRTSSSPMEPNGKPAGNANKKKTNNNASNDRKEANNNGNTGKETKG
jgi:hypothetical protein